MVLDHVVIHRVVHFFVQLRVDRIGPLAVIRHVLMRAGITANRAHAVHVGMRLAQLHRAAGAALGQAFIVNKVMVRRRGQPFCRQFRMLRDTDRAGITIVQVIDVAVRRVVNLGEFALIVFKLPVKRAPLMRTNLAADRADHIVAVALYEFPVVRLARLHRAAEAAVRRVGIHDEPLVRLVVLAARFNQHFLGIAAVVADMFFHEVVHRMVELFVHLRVHRVRPLALNRHVLVRTSRRAVAARADAVHQRVVLRNRAAQKHLILCRLAAINASEVEIVVVGLGMLIRRDFRVHDVVLVRGVILIGVRAGGRRTSRAAGANTVRVIGMRHVDHVAGILHELHAAGIAFPLVGIYIEYLMELRIIRLVIMHHRRIIQNSAAGVRAIAADRTHAVCVTAVLHAGLRHAALVAGHQARIDDIRVITHFRTMLNEQAVAFAAVRTGIIPVHIKHVQVSRRVDPGKGFLLLVSAGMRAVLMIAGAALILTDKADIRVRVQVLLGLLVFRPVRRFAHSLAAIRADNGVIRLINARMRRRRRDKSITLKRAGNLSHRRRARVRAIVHIAALQADIAAVGI